jgi:hypothetical protein
MKQQIPAQPKLKSKAKPEQRKLKSAVATKQKNSFVISPVSSATKSFKEAPNPDLKLNKFHECPQKAEI